MSDRRWIGPFRQGGRGVHGWRSDHDRARALAARRLDGALVPAEDAWLTIHLAECAGCRSVADAYDADRAALRRLRDAVPEPPRDLWARTAARIEAEAAWRKGMDRRARPAAPPAREPGARRGRRRITSFPALGALSGVAVVVLVVIATSISGGFLGQTPAIVSGPSASIAVASAGVPPASQLAVGAGKVRWLGADADGVFAYNAADIEFVCRHDHQPDCPPVADADAKRVTLEATPKYVFQSPVDFQAVVVGTDDTGADAVLVVPLPTPEPTPVASANASASPGASASDIATPAAVAPTDTPLIAPSQVAIGDLPSLDPSEPSLEPEATTDAASSSPEPEPTSAIAILTDVTVVGRAAGYSPDGSWFAFSARPADASTGPDVYVWHVGDTQARALTSDHASVFASWMGTHVVASRVVPPEGVTPTEPEAPASPDATTGAAAGLSSGSPAASPPAIESVPEAFVLDPWSGAEVGLLDAEWQPAIDPSRVAVVAWQGTVGLGSDGVTPRPATGNLVVHPFRGPLEFDDGSGVPVPSASPATPTPAASVSASPSVEASPGTTPAIALDFPAQVLATGPIVDFDARWDDTGTWLAVWIADPVDPGFGRLTLFHFDPRTGLIDQPIGAPSGVSALPGFSMGFGRLAWASPPGQAGEGSRIQVAAWIGSEVGAIESIPVENAIVVQ